MFFCKCFRSNSLALWVLPLIQEGEYLFFKNISRIKIYRTPINSKQIKSGKGLILFVQNYYFCQKSLLAMRTFITGKTLNFSTISTYSPCLPQTFLKPRVISVPSCVMTLGTPPQKRTPHSIETLYFLLLSIMELPYPNPIYGFMLLVRATFRWLRG